MMFGPEKYSDLEYFDRGLPINKIAGLPINKIAGLPINKISGLPINKIAGLPINKIAATLCIYKIFNVRPTC
jgi:predicted house-cleaning NTP pyrophosphatase (Maf/HAM1 superfamily)